MNYIIYIFLHRIAIQWKIDYIYKILDSPSAHEILFILIRQLIWL